VFIEKTRTALGELMARRLDDVRLAVMMLDGLEIAGRVHVVALGISTDGVKVPLGLWEGSTENATLARQLLADRRRDAPSRAAVPTRRRLQRPAEAHHRDRTTTPHHRTPEPDTTHRGGDHHQQHRSARYRLTINPMGSQSQFHDDPGNLRGARQTD
jgi:hypothetical protein